MRTLFCLTLFVLLIGTTEGQSANFQKGLEAVQEGDFAAALREWVPLAEQGNVEAQYRLGLMYHRGQGVQRDHKTAAQWYELAAKQGHPRAQSHLGKYYEIGQGVPQNYKMAVKWYALSAGQVYSQAQTNLGLMYGLGTGVEQSFIYAYMWGALASENGNVSGTKLRHLVAREMTEEQIAEARKLALECKNKNYVAC